MNTLINRMKKPTPRFFKKLRDIGLALTGISAAVLTAPVELPQVLVTIAGYMTVGAAVMSAVSQSAVKNEKT
jgi:hypothetical protein